MLDNDVPVERLQPVAEQGVIRPAEVLQALHPLEPGDGVQQLHSHRAQHLRRGDNIS